jgi:alanyl-tRNA synthetase
MDSSQIRRQFLLYFKERGHTIVPSSSVVPHNDPTLLFNNAGMNQFKDVFLGESARDYKRAASSQKCIRVGGKHNDLENVGHTSRHLTFFEMIGNFSFGDYFKEDAIKFAWEISTEVFGLDPQRIWPTVFEKDEEAYEIWLKYVPAKRISRMGKKTNYWSMGDTGPSGPCSELLFDRGPFFGDAQNPKEDLTEERYFEFWNLVFMQENTRPFGIVEPLPKPCIDTGAGLERIVDLKISGNSVFATDILRALIEEVEKISGIRYNPEDKQLAPAFHVIADHMRCLSFAISDGAQPGNVERGYVLRKVLRRAVRYGKKLGLDRPFLAKLLPTLVLKMGDDYGELKKAQGKIEELLTIEEESFLKTLKRGGHILSQIITESQHLRQISGDDAFKLKDTYGLPLDEILLLAKDSDLKVDEERFKLLELEAKERSKKAEKKEGEIASQNLFENTPSTTFLGYNTLSSEAIIIGIVKENQFVESLQEGEEGLMILDKTPFYAEKGGQVGDKGVLKTTSALFQVEDTKEPFIKIIAHKGTLKKGSLKVGDHLTASVDQKRRNEIANNHTATHLLHYALQKVLGDHIKQAGSLVTENSLRFDFNHHKALTINEIDQIEEIVNQKIRDNTPVLTYELSFEEVLKKEEIKQFFGDKYGKEVRVVDIEDSKELCGGTHAKSSGQIGYFRIVKEGSIAAGVRRIEALTGEKANLFAKEPLQLVEKLEELLKTPAPKLFEKVEKLLGEIKELTLLSKELKKGVLNDLAEKLSQKVKEIPHKVISEQVFLNPEEMKELADLLLQKVSPSVVVLGSQDETNATLVVKVSHELVKQGIKATEIIQTLAPLIEGRGGGKPESAQASGKKKENLTKALMHVLRNA